MERRVLGVIVTGGGGAPFDALGIGGDAALTPFGGKYRFIDFALAALANAGLATTYVLAPGPARELSAHLEGAERPLRPSVRQLPPEATTAGRARRILLALDECRQLVHLHEPELLVVLSADHILRLDPRPLVTACRRPGVDAALAVVVAASGTINGNAPLRVDEEGRVQSAGPTASGLTLAWSGDLALRAEALPGVVAACAADLPADDAGFVAALTSRLGVCAYEPGNAAESATAGRGTYWHQPTTLEAYYEAQMDLCTPRPAFDLHDPTWRLPRVASGLAPAKVVADAAGRCGQALNALVADGALIRGGVVINTIVGHDVVVESGAEVEDSILFDGCRIGCGARVRRAVVGAGAAIADHAQIGYGPPPPPARLFPSGLTLVPGGV